jgi:hypothetical protein
MNFFGDDLLIISLMRKEVKSPGECKKTQKQVKGFRIEHLQRTDERKSIGSNGSLLNLIFPSIFKDMGSLTMVPLTGDDISHHTFRPILALG